jgi:hypothetical protein
VWGGYYEPRSLIWRSRWVTDTGSIIECREALAFPGEPHRLVLLRRVVAESGPASVQVVLEPRAEYDQQSLRDLRREPDGSWTGRAGTLYLRWSGRVADARASGGTRLEIDLVVPAGQTADLILELSDRPLIDNRPDASDAWRARKAAGTRSFRSSRVSPPVGAVPAEDPRTTSTLDAYLRELVEEGYAYRFRHDDRPLGDAEGAFLLCRCTRCCWSRPHGSARSQDSWPASAGRLAMQRGHGDRGERGLDGRVRQERAPQAGLCSG